MPAHDAAAKSDARTHGGSEGGASEAGRGNDANDAHDAHDAHDDVVEGDSGHPDAAQGPEAGPGTDAGDHDAGEKHDSGPPKDTGVEPVCPASPPSGVCSMAETCNYPTQSCICGNDGMSVSMLWHCTMLNAGCPQDPPTIGAPCSQGGLVCDYGHCYGGEEVECTAGVWVAHVSGFCPG